jgi:hypothetical protein
MLIGLVAIPIDTDYCRSNRIIFRSFASNNLLPNHLLLNVGEDVFIMGYPLGIFDKIHNIPLTRGGTIASPYPIPWNSQPFFLVDANLENGTSGSPVITKFKETWRTIDGGSVITGLAMYVLGINSSTFPRQEGQSMPTGLNATYFARLIDQMTL